MILRFTQKHSLLNPDASRITYFHMESRSKKISISHSGKMKTFLCPHGKFCRESVDHSFSASFIVLSTIRLRPRRRPEPGGRPGHGRRGQQLAGYPALLLSRHPDRPGKLKTGRPLPLTGRAALFLVLFTGQALSG